MDKNKLYYLATPYSHKNSFVRQIRYEIAIYIASLLTRKGYRLIEPIGMCHEQSQRHGMPGGYTFWQERDRGLIDRCDAVLVIKMPGWKESEGVSDEIEYAKQTDKEVICIDTHHYVPQKVWNEIH